MSRSHHERVSATAEGAIFTEDVFLAGRLFAGAFLVVFLAGRLLAIVSPFNFIDGIYRLIMAHDRCSC